MKPLAAFALLLLPALGSAQDMPLFTFAKAGETWKPATGAKPKTPSPLEATSPDHSVQYSAIEPDGFVHAYSTIAMGDAFPKGGRYAALRIEQSYDNSKEAQAKRKKAPPKLAVTSLIVDSEGRIYAGTKLGIQVFDPTGRLCAVLALPAAGDPEHFGWEGDRLAVWIGDRKFIRAMKATGK